MGEKPLCKRGGIEKMVKAGNKIWGSITFAEGAGCTCNSWLKVGKRILREKESMT